MIMFAQTISVKPPLELDVRIPLSIMNFLEFAIWGAWFVTLGNYLNSMQFSRKDIGRIYATMALGSVISPMFVGTIADRYFASEQVMGVLHLVGAGLLYWMATIKTVRAFYWVALAYALVYAPTIALSGSLTFVNVPDGGRDFPTIRCWERLAGLSAAWPCVSCSSRAKPVNNRPLFLAADYPSSWECIPSSCLIRRLAER